MRRLSASILALALLLAPSIGTLFAAATAAPAGLGQTLVWPKPPAQARVGYLRSISAPRDWGISKSWFGRLFDALTGRGAEHFLRPTGVAERDGVLYVADPGARALWILDAAQNRSTKIVQIGDEALVSPVAVAIRQDGAVFVADSELRKVYLLDREGKLLRVVAETGLERPAALAYDAASGRLYIADAAAQRIAVYAADGAFIRTWGRAGSGEGEFNYPTHLVLDRAGSLLVTDALNFRIQAFDREGRFLWKLGRHGDGSGDFAAPKGLADDSAGHLFVVDALFGAVQIFDRDGNFLLGFGEQGTQPGQFWLPGGLFIDARDRIYVADLYNQRIQVFQVEPGTRDKAAR